jgi:hypothetical protein
MLQETQNLTAEVADRPTKRQAEGKAKENTKAKTKEQTKEQTKAPNIVSVGCILCINPLRQSSQAADGVAGIGSKFSELHTEMGDVRNMIASRCV